jgi:zinc/manganese transport system substrate-binding protein
MEKTVRKISGILGLITILLMFPALPAGAQDIGRITVAVTLPDLVPIVKTIGGSQVEVLGIMPPGSDPHGFTLTANAISTIQSADLIIYGNSGFLTFEGELKQAAPDIDSVDWPNYERHGAVLKSFPGYENCEHGFWLGFDNAKAIAAGIAEGLILKGLDIDIVTGRLASFNREIDSLGQSGRELMENLERDRSVWVAVVPGVAYTVDNLGLGVGAVIFSEASGFASGSELAQLEFKLNEREFAGLVCPISMKDSKAGEMAEQISADTGTPVCYVRFLDAEAGDSYLAQASYNMGILAAMAAKGSVIQNPGVPVSAHLVWAVIVFALLIAIVLQNKRMYYAGASVAGAGVFDKKDKKK